MANHNLEEIAKRLEPIINAKGIVTDYGEKYLFKPLGNYYAGYPVLGAVKYLSENSPGSLEKLAETLDKYELLFAESKEKAGKGRLKGRFEQDVFVPDGNPSKLRNQGLGLEFLPLLIAYPFLVPSAYFSDKAEEIERSSGGLTKAYAERACSRAFTYLAMPALFISGAIVIGLEWLFTKQPSKSEKAYFELCAYERNIRDIVDGSLPSKEWDRKKQRDMHIRLIEEQEDKDREERNRYLAR